MSACWLESRETSETRKGGSNTVRETNYAGNEYISYDAGTCGAQMNKKARQKHMKLFENSRSGCSQSREKLHKPIAGNKSLHTTACCSIGNTDRRANQNKNMWNKSKSPIPDAHKLVKDDSAIHSNSREKLNQLSLSSILSTAFSLCEMLSSRRDTVCLPPGC